MKVIYIADSGGHFSEEIATYEKRLQGMVEFVRIKPIKHSDREYVIRQETIRVIEYLERFKRKACLLDELWIELTTLEFADHLQKKYRNSWVSPIFIIGGAYWVDRQLISPHVEQVFSLSRLTLPHWLALLVFSEQIYRVHEIWKGSKYHHI